MKGRLTMSVFKSSLHPHYVNTAAAFGECEVPQPPLGRAQARSLLHGTAWQSGWPCFPFQDTHPHPTCTSMHCKAFPRKERGYISNLPAQCACAKHRNLWSCAGRCDKHEAAFSGSHNDYEHAFSSLHAYYFPVPRPRSLLHLMKACDHLSITSVCTFCNYPLVLSVDNY